MKVLKNKLRELEEKVSRGKEVYVIQIERTIIESTGQHRTENRIVTVQGGR